jgi:hypothetical protein
VPAIHGEQTEPTSLVTIFTPPVVQDSVEAHHSIIVVTPSTLAALTVYMLVEPPVALLDI